MHTFTKKLLALMLGAVLLLGLLAGCGEQKAPAKETVGNDTPKEAILSGMLILTGQASFKISYDQEGMVMEIGAANEDAEAIVSAYTDFAGKSTSTVVKELLTATAEATLLRGAKNIVVKLAIGSQLPSETFLDGVANTAAEAVADNGATGYVVAIGLEDLDAEGYINAENAQALLKNQLGVTEFELYNGENTPRNGCYTVNVKAGDVEGSYLIDAVTGIITETVDEEPAEPEYVEEEEFDAAFEETSPVMDEDVEADVPEDEPNE